eukprot:gnl/TRDRNA2_/TRDRNA2_40037_c0_seq1.p1 gnl/TRDRNA2_/TRDRNA2_40037_c0~~gnl/TRDRNA2_/TRDRNA2_40037_c0_seq1.p1  ORF type:complete len:377 (-),score=60.52 gnl/TRDRNA2_/TRDRNA2_40037_c0_seq1:165-1199(-)
MDAVESILWTQRIEKEEECVRKGGPAQFSVRAAISGTDVPVKFKPGHMHPGDAMKPGEHFDCSAVGWSRDSKIAKEFRRCIAQQTAGPRERHQFPVTTYQELGWCQSMSGHPSERSVAVPPLQNGIGWVYRAPKDRAKTPDYVDNYKVHVKVPKPCSINPETVSYPPFWFSGAPARKEDSKKAAEAQAAEAKPAAVTFEPPAAPVETEKQRIRREKHERKMKRREMAAAGETYEEMCKRERAEKREKLRASASEGELTRAGGASAMAKSSSLPELRIKQDEQLIQQEQQLDKAYNRVDRLFLRRRGNRWYRPVNNSDVALFADAYTKAWGVGLYTGTRVNAGSK